MNQETRKKNRFPSGVSLEFLGGAKTVTGSKFLIRAGKSKILVDCGLFQGLKDLRLLNWAPFPLPPHEITSVVLTHAHLDHSGYLPLLVKNGFAGKIYCTYPTRDIASILLMDSAKIQEEDAARANFQRTTKHHPAKPLYRMRDAERAINLLYPVALEQWMQIDPQFHLRLSSSGHIVGSSFVELRIKKKVFVFSGDLGREKPIFLEPRSTIRKADFLILESTYGNRNHAKISPIQKLRTIITETIKKKGQLLVPAFAVGRTQDLLFLLYQLKKKNQIPDVPIYLDSPLAIHATDILANYPTWLKPRPKEVNAICNLGELIRTTKESQELLKKDKPCIIIAGSGMLTGGRILSHLEKRLPDPKNTILLVGFQAEGTRGRQLQEKASELKIYGKYVPVRARVEEISELSCHADQSEILSWLSSFHKAPAQTFLVHGEPHASDALRVKIQDQLGSSWKIQIPQFRQKFELQIPAH